MATADAQICSVWVAPDSSLAVGFYGPEGEGAQPTPYLGHEA